MMSSRDDVDLSDWETIEPTQPYTASAAPSRQAPGKQHQCSAPPQRCKTCPCQQTTAGCRICRSSAEISQGTIRCLMATFSACRQQTLRAMQGIGEAMLHQSPKT